METEETKRITDPLCKRLYELLFTVWEDADGAEVSIPGDAYINAQNIAFLIRNDHDHIDDINKVTILYTQDRFAIVVKTSPNTVRSIVTVYHKDLTLSEFWEKFDKEVDKKVHSILDT